MQHRSWQEEARAELEGASTIHSADDNLACGIFVLVLNDWVRLTFVSVTVNWLFAP